MEAWREELYHHGILGMKWGRKQGPPYPLDASDHSAAEKKAGYKKSIGGERNEELYDRKKMSRQDKKAIKQEMKKNTFGEHYTKAGREVHEEITKTNEYKKMEEYHNQLQEVYNQLQKEHPGAQLLVPKDYKQEYVKRQHELNLKANEIISKNTSKLASAKLKDLNIKETAKTRAYIEKLMSQQYEDDRKKEEKRYKAELKK